MLNLKKLILKSVLITTCGLTLYGAPLSSDAQDGKELYDEANCKKCHLVEIDGSFDKINEKVQTLEDLSSWVSACDNNLAIGWFPEEQKKVAKYLNETHYKLKK
jgi:hypothetical protein